MRGPTIEEVDAAVRSVLGALFAAPSPGADREGLHFAGRLLGLRDAERLAGTTRVVRIAPGTVVTPLAKDHLRRLEIGVEWVSRGEIERLGRRGEWGFAIESEGGMIGAVRRELLNQGEAWHDLGPDAESAARWVASRSERGAAVLTGEASVAAWRANRVDGVRAATVVDADSVVRAASALGANLIVVEPRGKSIFEVRHLLATFRRLGPQGPADRWGAERRWGGPDDADRRGHRASHPLAGPSQPQEPAAARGGADAIGGPGGGLGRAW